MTGLSVQPEVLHREEGQDLGEYALLFALIALVVVAAVMFFGTSLSAFFARLALAIAGW